MSAEEIMELVQALEIPDGLSTSNRYKFTAIEALCLLIARFRFAGDIYELTTRYDRAESAISEIVNDLVIFLDNKWSHLLEFDSCGLLSPERLERYADAVYQAGAPIRTIWGFIDCTLRHICKPGLFQRAAYSGHKRYHALKFQAIRLPNGLFGHLYGPVEGRRNDAHLLEESGLLDQCREHAVRPGTDANTPAADRFLQLFGDPAYGVTYQIQSPFAGVGAWTEEEKEWNHLMGAVRIEVEHGFGDVSRMWPFLNAWWKLKVYASPIGRYYRVAVLLTNAVNCIRPNQTAQYFNCMPPPLHIYFHH